MNNNFESDSDFYIDEYGNPNSLSNPYVKPVVPYSRSIKLYNDEIGKVEYVQHMGQDITIVNAARVSFDKEIEILSESDLRLMKYLINNKHTSTLEHNVITFRFTVPLFVRSQHHRHRTWSYNEISRRYTKENIQFYFPDEFRTQHESNRQASNENELINPEIFWEHDDFIIPESLTGSYANMKLDSVVKSFTHNALRFYTAIVDAGVCKEQARMVLPQNMYTKYYGTVNLNNLLKFIDLRDHKNAQPEIQVVAKACLDIALDIWPHAVTYYRSNREDIAYSEDMIK